MAQFFQIIFFDHTVVKIVGECWSKLRPCVTRGLSLRHFPPPRWSSNGDHVRWQIPMNCKNKKRRRRGWYAVKKNFPPPRSPNEDHVRWQIMTNNRNNDNNNNDKYLGSCAVTNSPKLQSTSSNNEDYIVGGKTMGAKTNSGEVAMIFRAGEYRAGRSHAASRQNTPVRIF